MNYKAKSRSHRQTVVTTAKKSNSASNSLSANDVNVQESTKVPAKNLQVPANFLQVPDEKAIWNKKKRRVMLEPAVPLETIKEEE